MTPKRCLFGSLALVVALGGACVPPEPDEDLVRDFDPETTVMGAIQEAGTLRAGVTSNQALYREAGGEPAGLAADLALEISDTLGVDADFTVASNEDLLVMVEDGTVDVAFPLTPVVEELVRQAGVSDPYFIAHQRVLVPGASDATTVEELDGEVCSVGEHELLVALGGVSPSVHVTDAEEASDCYEASEVFVDKTLTPPTMTGLDLDLVGAAYNLQALCPPEAECLPPKIVGDELTTAGISVFVEKGASGWLGFVDNVLGDFKSEGHWLESYNESLESYLGPQRAPEITVEEAAALYPREL